MIEQEAMDFYANHGKLSLKALQKEGRHDLWGAITKSYPGAMKALKAKVASRPESLSRLLEAYEKAVVIEPGLTFERFLQGV